MVIDFHKDFTKSFEKISPKIKAKFQERLLLFEKDEFDPILNNHALKGEYLGYRSINVTGNLRALYKKDNDKVIFVSIDSHSNLYG